MEPNQIAESQASQAIDKLRDRLAFVATSLTASDWSIIKHEIKVAVRNAINQAKKDPESPRDYRGPLQLGKPYYSDSDLFPFGKPKEEGQTFAEVPEGYFRWLADQPWLREKWPGIARYIDGETEDNLPKEQEENQVEGASGQIPF